jgi:hypothetical protein
MWPAARSVEAKSEALGPGMFLQQGLDMAAPGAELTPQEPPEGVKRMSSGSARHPDSLARYLSAGRIHATT